MSDQPTRVGPELSTKSDPTALTTDALQREIAQARALTMAEMEAIHQSIQDQRELRVAQIQTLQEQIAHAEKLRIELKGDNEKNIDRALNGVEKATEKLEANLTLQLTRMVEANKADVEGLRRDIDGLKDRINDNKERVVGVEQQKIGAKEDRTGLYATVGICVTVLLAALTVVGFLAAQH